MGSHRIAVTAAGSTQKVIEISLSNKVKGSSTMFSKFVLSMGLIFAAIADLIGGAAVDAAGICAGCAQESDVNQDIVDFAMAQLSYGDCQRGSAQIHNFKSQVVAGTKYSFDISLDPSKCDKDAESERTTCHIKVINVPWLGKQEVLWDETTCEKQAVESAPISPCVGCSQESEVNQDIVDFAMAELSYGDCQRGSAKIENFESQVVSGTLYSFDISLTPSQCDEDADDEKTTCHIKVLNVPWLGKQEVLWDRSTCSQPE